MLELNSGIRYSKVRNNSVERVERRTGSDGVISGILVNRQTRDTPVLSRRQTSSSL